MNDTSKTYLEKLQINILQKELEKRKRLDSKYSLRVFAEEANLDTSTMSKYLNGKRKLTPTAFNLIIRKLRFDDEILDQYNQELQNYEFLGQKHQKIKSHWYYHGILESINLYDFEASPEWIAGRLNLPIETIKDAIQDLVETDVLKIEDGKYINNYGNTTFIEDPNHDEEAGRNYQKELLDLARNSIDLASGEIKDHTSICFAFDSALTLEVKKKIDQFQSELGDFIEKNSRNFDEVYTLQVNLNSVATKQK